MLTETGKPPVNEEVSTAVADMTEAIRASALDKDALADPQRLLADTISSSHVIKEMQEKMAVADCRASEIHHLFTTIADGSALSAGTQDRSVVKLRPEPAVHAPKAEEGEKWLILKEQHLRQLRKDLTVEFTDLEIRGLGSF